MSAAMTASLSHSGESTTATAGSVSDTKWLSDETIEQIVYTSAAYTRDLHLEELDHILETSRINNQRDGITGLLLYRDGSFVQFLEGPQARLRRCYERIKFDHRHRGLVEIYRNTSDRRDFSEWNMAFRLMDHNLSFPPASSSSSDLAGARKYTAATGRAPGGEEERERSYSHQQSHSSASSAAKKQEADRIAKSASAQGMTENMRDLSLRNSGPASVKGDLRLQSQDAFQDLLQAGQIELPPDMSKRMRTLITTFVRLLSRPL